MFHAKIYPNLDPNPPSVPPSLPPRAQISVVLFGFEISIMFVIGAYFVLHSTFLYSQKPPSAAGPAEPTAGTAGTANGDSKNGGGAIDQIELPEKESLLGVGLQTDSPRTRAGRSSSLDGGRPRKANLKFGGDRDTDPV